MLSTTLAPLLGGLVGGSHCSVERRELAHHTLVGVLLICMNGLGMLAQIVETRELLATMASEGTLASMFSVDGVGGEPGTG